MSLIDIYIYEHYRTTLMTLFRYQIRMIQSIKRCLITPSCLPPSLTNTSRTSLRRVCNRCKSFKRTIIMVVTKFPPIIKITNIINYIKIILFNNNNIKHSKLHRPFNINSRMVVAVAASPPLIISHTTTIPEVVALRMGPLSRLTPTVSSQLVVSSSITICLVITPTVAIMLITVVRQQLVVYNNSTTFLALVDLTRTPKVVLISNSHMETLTALLTMLLQLQCPPQWQHQVGFQMVSKRCIVCKLTTMCHEGKQFPLLEMRDKVIVLIAAVAAQMLVPFHLHFQSSDQVVFIPLEHLQVAQLVVLLAH